MALKIGPHGDDEIAALQDQVVAQVEAEEIDDDHAAPTLVASCSARCREDAMEANQVFRFHISRTNRIRQEWPLQIVEPAHVVAGPPAVPADWKVVFLVVLIAGLARRQIVEAVVGKLRIAASHRVTGIKVVLSSEPRIRPTPDGTLGPEMLDVVLPPPAPALRVIFTEAPLRPWHRTLAVSALEVLNPDEDVLDVTPVRLLATLRLGKPVRILRRYLSSQLAAADPVADHRPEFRSARRLAAIGT